MSSTANGGTDHDDAVPADDGRMPASGVLTELWKTIPKATARRERERRFSQSALHCLSASIQRDRDRLVHGSADVLLSLLELWATNTIDPAEVWAELYKRLELGHLLMKLNQDHTQARRRILKPWKVDSTKLP